MLVSYYLPGNRSAPPPATVQEGPPSRRRRSRLILTPVPPGRWLAEEQATWDPIPPERWLEEEQANDIIINSIASIVKVHWNPSWYNTWIVATCSRIFSCYYDFEKMRSINSSDKRRELCDSQHCWDLGEDLQQPGQPHCCWRRTRLICWSRFTCGKQEQFAASTLKIPIRWAIWRSVYCAGEQEYMNSWLFQIEMKCV